MAFGVPGTPALPPALVCVPMMMLRPSSKPTLRNASLWGILWVVAASCACRILAASAVTSASARIASTSSSPNPVRGHEDAATSTSHRFRWFVPRRRRRTTDSMAKNATSPLLLPPPHEEHEKDLEEEDSPSRGPVQNPSHKGGDVADAAPSNENPASADFVRNQLRDRLDRVLSGKRQKDVAEWIQYCRTNNIVVSDDLGLIASLLDSDPLAGNNKNVRQRQQIRDPFPLNRFNLELVPEVDMMGDGALDGGDSSQATNSSVAVATQAPNHEASTAAVSARISSLASTVVAKAVWATQFWMRTIQLSWNFGPVGSTVGLAYLSPNFRNNYWYKWLAQSMGKSGPAFIKWGQWSSTRPDLFPDAFCDALSALHANAPAHSWSYSESTLASALQLPLKSSTSALTKVFDEIDHAPLASGSIAQVHKAVLDGRLVAIKIRHPKVEQLMEMDFTIMNWAAAILDGTIPLVKWLHVRETLTQFSTSLKAQADLRVEANHLELLNHNFRGWPHVRFPHPIFASSAVIIETFEPGRIVTTVLDMYDHLADTINREDALKELEIEEVRIKQITASHTDDDKVSVPSAPSYALVASGGSRKGESDVSFAVAITNSDKPEPDGGGDDDDTLQGHHLVPIAIAKFLVTTGLGVYLKMLLVDNLMHADLHPGNIMVNFHRHYHNHPDRKGLRRRGRNQRRINDSMLTMVPHKDLDVSPKHLDRLLGICLVDAGMVAQLTEQESSTFIGLLSSLGEGDGISAADFALKFSLENHMSAESRDAFARDMVDLFAERCRGYGTNVDVGHVLRGVLGLVRKHRVRIDANFATLVVNCLCIESLARSFCPTYNVLDAAKPLLQSYRKLFYTKDGTPKRNARRSKFVKLWLSVMYVKKNWQDRAFFRREERRNKDRTRSQRLLLEIPG